MTAAQWAREVAVWLPEGWTVTAPNGAIHLVGPSCDLWPLKAELARLPDLGAWVRSIVGAA